MTDSVEFKVRVDGYGYVEAMPDYPDSSLIQVGDGEPFIFTAEGYAQGTVESLERAYRNLGVGDVVVSLERREVEMVRSDWADFVPAPPVEPGEVPDADPVVIPEVPEEAPAEPAESVESEPPVAE